MPPLTPSANGETQMSMTNRTELEIEAYYANRRAAGAAIDIETCEIRCWYAPDFDPYDIGDRAIEGCASRQLFVRSADSDGWINECSLPAGKYKALRARIRREP
jgi:hypothetical protein